MSRRQRACVHITNGLLIGAVVVIVLLLAIGGAW